MKKFFLFAAAAMMALVGCEKQVQSSLDFADVKKEAKITGQLGFWYSEPGGATNFIGLGDQKIWFEVGADEYAGDAPAKAKKVFEATTTAGDSAGYFTITVPMGETRLKGDLKTDVIRYVHNGKVFYFSEFNKPEMSLIAGNNKVEQVVVKKDVVLSECVGEGQLKGKLVRDAGTLKNGGYDESGKIAAEGFTVVAHVTYFEDKAKTVKLIKDFIAVSDKNGEFLFKAIPAYDEGNEVEVEVKKKDASYREYKDNQWVETVAPYSLAPTKVENIKINEVADAGKLPLTKGASVDPTTMTKKVKVKGEITRTGEKFKMGKGDEAKKIEKLESVTDLKYNPEINGGAFELIIIYTDPETAEKSEIIYNLKTDEDGKYETEVAIYDAWAYKDIKVKVNVKKFVYSEYAHYYYKIYKTCSSSKDYSEWEAYTETKNYQDWTDKDNFTNHYGTQACIGTYEGESKEVEYEGFFAITVDANLKFKMSDDSKEALFGVGKNDNDKMKDKAGDEYVIYGGGIDY